MALQSNVDLPVRKLQGSRLKRFCEISAVLWEHPLHPWFYLNKESGHSSIRASDQFVVHELERGSGSRERLYVTTTIFSFLETYSSIEFYVKSNVFTDLPLPYIEYNSKLTLYIYMISIRVLRLSNGKAQQLSPNSTITWRVSST